MSDNDITITGKTILGVSVLVVILIITGFYLTDEMGEDTDTGYMIAGNQVSEEEARDFIDCLDEGGVTIYGTHTCSACTQLAESLGGFDLIGQIFVECSQEQQRCSNEMKRTAVPEIHINGQHYNTGVVSPGEIADEVNCELP
ncbi:MAG: hypothetical protein ACLFTY_01730 [Candidatus Aenigmatarchaeota archaeon]